MKLHLALAALFAALSFASAGEKEIFNGKDLSGWEGNKDLWSVQDGTITGKTPADPAAPTKSILKHNTFLVWKGGTVGDFELTFQYRIEKGNSGVQYRSKELPAGEFGPIISGYQADFEAGKTYSGILYEERGRGILAKRGEKTVIKPAADGGIPVPAGADRRRPGAASAAAGHGAGPEQPVAGCCERIGGFLAAPRLHPPGQALRPTQEASPHQCLPATRRPSA